MLYVVIYLGNHDAAIGILLVFMSRSFITPYGCVTFKVYVGINVH